MNCSTCHFWREGRDGVMECRRHAPARFLNNYAAWPKTDEEDWCGDCESNAAEKLKSNPFYGEMLAMTEKYMTENPMAIRENVFVLLGKDGRPTGCVELNRPCNPITHP